MDAAASFSSIEMAVFALVGGLTLLLAGGEILVAGATRLAGRLGMSPLLIGLTVVAFGTSMPELFVSLTATLEGYPDIMVGNVIGSNIANIGLVLGVSALIRPLAASLAIIAGELYLLLAVGLVVFALSWHGYFGRPVGLLFVGVLVAFTFLSYCRERRLQNVEQAPTAEGGPAVSCHLGLVLLLVIGGLLLLMYGSGYFIDGAVHIARYFGVGELVIGLTLAAIGTSLPELASCMAAIRQRQDNLLLGNVVGSNLFNLLMVMGLTAVVKPFPLSSQLLWRDLPVMLGFSALLIPALAFRQRLSRLHGMVLLSGYAAYLFLLR